MEDWGLDIEVKGVSKKRIFNECAPHGYGEFYCASNKKGDKIIVDGNPQTNESGQNVQPSLRQATLVEAFLRNALAIALPGKTSAITERAIKNRNIRVTRIALALDFVLDDPNDGPEVIRAINYVFRYLAPRKTGNLWHEGPIDQSTYYRPNSKYWGLKAYLKGPQVIATWGKEHTTLPCHEKLLRLADRIVRIELVLMYRELERLKLLDWKKWKRGTPKELMLKYLAIAKLDADFRKGPPSGKKSDLTSLEHLAHLAYMNGYDLRNELAPGTYRRYVGALLSKRGVDIRIPRPRGKRPRVNLLDQIHRGARRGVRTWAKDAGLFRHWSDPQYLQKLRAAGRLHAKRFEKQKRKWRRSEVRLS